MVILNLSLLLINLLVIIFGYIIIKNSLEKKIINKDVMNDVKKEINLMMININDTTLTNISVIEEKIVQLKDISKFVDKKMGLLEIKMKKIKQNDDKNNSNIENITYSHQKIVKQSKKNTEIINNEKKDAENKLEEELKGKTIVEKIKFLHQKGLDSEDIRKKIKLDKGEFELLLNFENIQL